MIVISSLPGAHKAGEQVVVTNGKRLLTGAHQSMRPQDRGRIVFIRDCDDDVRRGELKPAPDLIVTKHADVEADLIALGALEKVVAELVDGAVASHETLKRITEELVERALGVGIPLGRVRRAAHEAGVALEFESHDLNFDRLREAGVAKVELERAADEIARLGRLTSRQQERIQAKIDAIPGDALICNGKDLIAAAGAILKSDFRVRSPAVRSMTQLVRIGVTDRRDTWDVVRRIRLWESQHGRRVLA